MHSQRSFIYLATWFVVRPKENAFVRIYRHTVFPISPLHAVTLYLLPFALYLVASCVTRMTRPSSYRSASYESIFHRARSCSLASEKREISTSSLTSILLVIDIQILIKFLKIDRYLNILIFVNLLDNDSIEKFPLY